MSRRWDEKYQFKYNKCISISRNDACSRSERPRSGLKKYKVNDHGIIICKYLESDEIDNLWPFLRLEMEWKKITIPIAIRQGFGTYITTQRKINKWPYIYTSKGIIYIYPPSNLLSLFHSHFWVLQLPTFNHCLNTRLQRPKSQNGFCHTMACLKPAGMSWYYLPLFTLPLWFPTTPVFLIQIA